VQAKVSTVAAVSTPSRASGAVVNVGLAALVIGCGAWFLLHLIRKRRTTVARPVVWPAERTVDLDDL
jgi:hypothetical protein